MWRPDPEVEKLCLTCKEGQNPPTRAQEVRARVCLTPFLLSIFCVLGFRVTIRVVVQESERVRRSRSSVCVCRCVSSRVLWQDIQRDRSSLFFQDGNGLFVCRSLQTLSVHRQDLIASFQTPVRRCRALKSADTQHVYIPSASQHVTSSDRDGSWPCWRRSSRRSAGLRADCRSHRRCWSRAPLNLFLGWCCEAVDRWRGGGGETLGQISTSCHYSWVCVCVCVLTQALLCVCQCCPREWSCWSDFPPVRRWRWCWCPPPPEKHTHTHAHTPKEKSE